MYIHKQFYVVSKIERNLKYIGCNHIGFNRKIGRDRIGFSCETSIFVETSSNDRPC